MGNRHDDFAERYARQTVLPEIGPEGQARLAAASVLVVGAGGLGSPALLYLAAAGVGGLGIVDADTVDAGNLQRQIAHGEADVGSGKVVSATNSARRVNSRVEIVGYEELLTPENAASLIAPYDVVVGCVDSIRVRYTLDAACVAAAKPHVYGSVGGFEGQASVFRVPGPCYRCFFREPPPADWTPTPLDKGILGPVAGVIGCIQATEALKLILNIGSSLIGRLLLYDALPMSFRSLSLRSDPACPACGMAQRGEEGKGAG